MCCCELEKGRHVGNRLGHHPLQAEENIAERRQDLVIKTRDTPSWSIPRTQNYHEEKKTHPILSISDTLNKQKYSSPSHSVFSTPVTVQVRFRHGSSPQGCDCALRPSSAPTIATLRRGLVAQSYRDRMTLLFFQGTVHLHKVHNITPLQ